MKMSSVIFGYDKKKIGGHCSATVRYLISKFACKWKSGERASEIAKECWVFSLRHQKKNQNDIQIDGFFLSLSRSDVIAVVQARHAVTHANVKLGENKFSHLINPISVYSSICSREQWWNERGKVRSERATEKEREFQANRVDLSNKSLLLLGLLFLWLVRAKTRNKFNHNQSCVLSLCGKTLCDATWENIQIYAVDRIQRKFDKVETKRMK